MQTSPSLVKRLFDAFVKAGHFAKATLKTQIEVILRAAEAHYSSEQVTVAAEA